MSCWHIYEANMRNKTTVTCPSCMCTNLYSKVYNWDIKNRRKPVCPPAPGSAAASQRVNRRHGEYTICGGPTLSEGGVPSVQTTWWKPRGGAQPDSLGSAWLPRAAAPAPSQDPSWTRNTTRNCNPSQFQHPEMLPLLQPHLQSAPHLLRLSAGGPAAPECTTVLCGALSI